MRNNHRTNYWEGGNRSASFWNGRACGLVGGCRAGLLQGLRGLTTTPSCLLRQILNQTSRMEIQLLETSLSTNKMEKQLLLQGHELHRLQGCNRWALAPWHRAGTRAWLGPE